MKVPAEFVEELVRLKEMPHLNIKVIAFTAGVTCKTIHNIIGTRQNQGRAHFSTMREIAEKFQTLRPKLPQKLSQ